MSGGVHTIAFCGGVGGAKLALGLTQVLPPEQLLIVGNTGDDFDHLGLRICPDLDTVSYTLAGLANRSQGWGLEGESWHCMAALSGLGGADWFRLGDRDIATHLYRSQRLREGATLSEVTAELGKAMGIAHRLLPMSDDPVATIVATPEGELGFQDYFVRRRCEPAVMGFRFAGAGQARVHPEVLAALGSAQLRQLIFCPSNPFVSIGPMLALPGMREALQALRVPVVAVSPIIGGQAVKGPAAKMMSELGLPVSSLALAGHYRDLVSDFIVDQVDAAEVEPIRALGLRCAALPTLMRDDADKRALATALLHYCDGLAR